MPRSAELYILHLHVPVNVVLSQRQNGCFRAVFSGSIFFSCSNLHLKEGSQLNSNCSEMIFYRIEFNFGYLLCFHGNPTREGRRVGWGWEGDVGGLR